MQSATRMMHILLQCQVSTGVKLFDMRISGVGVIDFESWRPTYRQNWASLNTYRDKSKALEKKLHPFWAKERIESEVSRD